eukprot:Tbor_TRINITY_DN6225_c3_g1::TRINITY_DN6225_c3_g1_i1::g.1950::m.1950
MVPIKLKNSTTISYRRLQMGARATRSKFQLRVFTAIIIFILGIIIWYEHNIIDESKLDPVPNLNINKMDLDGLDRKVGDLSFDTELTRRLLNDVINWRKEWGSTLLDSSLLSLEGTDRQQAEEPKDGGLLDLARSNMHTDIHLIAVWPGAMDVLERILVDVSRNFVVLKLMHVDWRGSFEAKMASQGNTRHSSSPSSLVPFGPTEFFLENLWQLYSGKGGIERATMRQKVYQCGGPKRVGFVAIVVMDPGIQKKNNRSAKSNEDGSAKGEYHEHSVVYKDLTTAHGVDRVSEKMFMKKKLYRSWAASVKVVDDKFGTSSKDDNNPNLFNSVTQVGGSFRVHGTYTSLEAEHDIRILFGESPMEIAINALLPKTSSGKPSSKEMSAAGATQIFLKHFKEIPITGNVYNKYKISPLSLMVPPREHSSEAPSIILGEDYISSHITPESGEGGGHSLQRQFTCDQVGFYLAGAAATITAGASVVPSTTHHRGICEHNTGLFRSSKYSNIMIKVGVRSLIDAIGGTSPNVSTSEYRWQCEEDAKMVSALVNNIITTSSNTQKCIVIGIHSLNSIPSSNEKQAFLWTLVATLYGTPIDIFPEKGEYDGFEGRNIDNIIIRALKRNSGPWSLTPSDVHYAISDKSRKRLQKNIIRLLSRHNADSDEYYSFFFMVGIQNPNVDIGVIPKELKHDMYIAVEVRIYNKVEK